jgi:hypothetical protein
LPWSSVSSRSHDTEFLFEFEAVLQRRAGVLVFQHLVLLEFAQVQVSLVPALKGGELVGGQQSRRGKRCFSGRSCSSGGVLTAWIVGKTERFKAAVASKPVINWYSFALTADE